MTPLSIPVVIEARHVRLTAAHVALLFGDGHAPFSLVPLEHTKRFATADVVEVRGPGGSCKQVRVLGPTVESTGVFVSNDDMHALGFGGSGLDSTCSIDGPRGTIVLASGVVHQLRRLVVTREVASEYGLTVGQGASVVVHGERARELRGVAVEIDAACYVGVYVADANAMDIGPTTSASLGSKS